MSSRSFVRLYRYTRAVKLCGFHFTCDTVHSRLLYTAVARRRTAVAEGSRVPRIGYNIHVRAFKSSSAIWGMGHGINHELLVGFCYLDSAHSRARSSQLAKRSALVSPT